MTHQSPAVTAGKPSVLSSSSAAFSGTVDPEGLGTTAHFEYGLDPKYSGTGSTTIVYDQTTPDQSVGSDFTAHNVSATVTGLVPNALYHVRLVATNTAGTATGPDQTFTTLKDPAPPAPVLGKEANFFPVNGLVFVKFPGSHSAADQFGPNAAFTKGQGFIPLTEARQLPIGTQVDARRGTLKIATATSHQGKTQSGVFSSGLFKLTQTRRGFHKGLTTLSLLEGAFPGAPSYASCSAKATDPGAHTARVNFSNLNVLRSRDHRGQFRTRGRYSAGTVQGTVWDTIDRCAGTLTRVHRGTVSVLDFHRHKTILVHAGHSYLARAFKKRGHK